MAPGSDVQCRLHTDQKRRKWGANGCQRLWRNDSAAEFEFGSGSQRFLVTLHHGLVPTRVGVFYLEVEDVDVWHRHIESLDLPSVFPGVRYSSPEITEWGWRLFYLWGPAGTLLHIGKPAQPDDA
jgi:hypothetical protein